MELITQESVAKLYLAIFGRPLDNLGLQYWTSTGIYENSGSSIQDMETLSENFSLQEEFTLHYPLNTTNETFIKTIYQNLFQREPDQDGLQYWIKEISLGNMTQSNAILMIINGAQGADKENIDNRTALSLDLALQGVLTTEYATDETIIEYIQNVNSSVSSISQQLENISQYIKINTEEVEYSFINNSIGTTLSDSAFFVETLDSNTQWSPFYDTITYSFNQSIPSDYYEYGDKLTNGWQPLNFYQEETARDLIEQLDNILDVNFQEVFAEGMIQFNIVEMENSNELGFAFYPGVTYDYSGDVFLSTDYNSSNSALILDQGEMGWFAIAHELGHALGLKHPFEGDYTLPDSLDNTYYSIMSYTSFSDYVPHFTATYNEISYVANTIEPQLYSLYDVATLQLLYGANMQSNIDNTVYTTSFSDYKIQTIWDAGGEDTIDLSATIGDTTIDLSEGTLNSVDQYTTQQIAQIHQNYIEQSNWNSWIEKTIEELYANNNLYTGKNNFAIAYGTIIENITTGSGSDSIKDNEVDNIIIAGDGDDIIYLGDGGFDTVDGGSGDDIIYLDISKSQITLSSNADNSYNLVGDDFAVNFTNIERINFIDNSFLLEEQFLL